MSIHAPLNVDIEYKALDYTCVNWGTPGAGPSFFLKDPVVLEGCSNSQACVISVMGAVAMSNRLYSVFKRRNSRVKTTSASLKAMFPNLNLDGFRFAHNMLRLMHNDNPSNFKVLEIELKEAWIARMCELLDEIETTRVLLWMSERTPDESLGLENRSSFVWPPHRMWARMKHCKRKREWPCLLCHVRER